MIQTTTTLLFNLRNECIALLIIILAFLAPVTPLILVVGVAIILDTLLGIYKANYLKEKITSKKLSKIVSKMCLYQGAIVLFFIIEKYILFDFVILFTSIPFFITKIIALVLISIELKSLDESYQAITGKSIWKSFKELLARTKEIKTEIEDIAHSDESTK